MDIAGKVVLVTGSSSGIGRAIAVECAKAGAEVLIHYRKNRKGAEETAKEVEKFSKARIIQADLSKPQEVTRLFNNLKKTTTVDFLVNNAGEAELGNFDDIDKWVSQFQNIFFSAVYVTNEFLKSDKDGTSQRRIINISSAYGIPEMSNPRLPQYSAAKSALNNFTLALAKKLAPSVLVNAIAPGYVWTPAWEGTSEEALNTRANLTKIKRFINPEEIATMVIEILQSDAMTGEIVRIDGGLHLLELP